MSDLTDRNPPYDLKDGTYMKTQQRKFVVELKSARRRSTIQPASIWGDTDLKTLAREAEADAPHLFEPDTVSDVPKRESELWSDPIPETHLNDEVETGDDKRIAASSLETEQTCPSQKDDGAIFASVSQPKEGSSSRSRKNIKRRREANIDNADEMTSGQSNASHDDISGEELIALEEENRRLKALLMKYLRQENMQIRQMLARFSDQREIL
ncbi:MULTISPECIES: hypothetical protein [Rhizobium]|uniref:Uncharacterized protein n=4 Tax=Rhizobium TaxID=379 RepID=A0A7X0MF63_9HYPH|nr:MULTISPECIES: hypothetical protein [Rhizobium]MBB5596218.1 hypothetical protein [Rhizobium tropici]MBB6305337.1 hypothetical protein [Rhizobium leucaenae]MBB6488196.1 hypothetical protein [Rhizobium lusitanum]MDK4743434.1 hypothetical protein [Rhizobium sp. CNPSo 3464]